LKDLREEIGDCQRCKLSAGRKNIVFGIGNADAKILFIGDVVGGPGRRLVKERAAAVKAEYGASLVIANVENVAGGAGVTPEMVRQVIEAGVDVASSGNHVFALREAAERLD
jgi:calcineurin-like phosphoesterase